MRRTFHRTSHKKKCNRLSTERFVSVWKFVVPIDFDGDGWIDLYTSEWRFHFSRNRVTNNNTFERKTASKSRTWIL